MCVFFAFASLLRWKGLIKRSSFSSLSLSLSLFLSLYLAHIASHFAESLKFEYDIISLMSFTITIMIIQHRRLHKSNIFTWHKRLSVVVVVVVASALTSPALWQQFLYISFVIFLTVLKLKFYSWHWQNFNYPDQNQMQLIKCTSRHGYVCMCVCLGWRFHLFTVSHLDVFAFAHTKASLICWQLSAHKIPARMCEGVWVCVYVCESVCCVAP